jgi:hypothetical protein
MSVLRVRFAFLLLFLTGSAAAQGTLPWQQRVAYEMDIRMDAPNHRMTGRQRLTYHNNAPDTLRQVFYHLYFNAFQPGSLMAERNRHLPDPDARVVPRIYNYTPDEIGYHRINTLTQDGQPVAYRVDDTILRVDLARPIPPGGQAVFDMTFNSQVPLQTRRSGWKSREGVDFSMAQWYPKLAHYDSRGWHADPYIGREFYGTFGTFDVKITIPAEYVLGATGVLQNAEAIGHGYQRDTTRRVAHAPGTDLTWHFRAENVHDFAWAADRDYVHERLDGPGGRQYHLLYQRGFEGGWHQMRAFVPAVIAYFESRFGPYIYPQFTAVQAGDGGMEYPMINFNAGGRTPGSLYGVTAHEAAHEWFYGMIATNENDFAWMDEGFTDWATDEALQALFNAPVDPTANTKALVALRQQGTFEPLSKPADWYDRNRSYSQAAYAGGAMIADLLGYVLSDSVRDRGFREYVRRYTLRHPQPADVERTFEHVSGIQLDWFFEQLTRTTRSMDYKVERVDVRGNSTYVRLHRRDRMFFPLDVRLTMADGTTRMVTIPTSEMYGAKPVGPGWTVAPAWGWTFPKYTLAVPGRVQHVQLDPERRTPDRNRLNDASRFPVRSTFLAAPVASEAHYSIGWRPLLNYADDYGVGVGVRAAGTYWLNRLNFKGILTLWPEVIGTIGKDPNTGTAPADRSWLEGLDYSYRFETGLPRAPVTRAEFRADKHLGFLEETLQIRHAFGRQAVLGRDRGVVTAWIQHQRQPWDRAWGFYAYDDSDARGYGDEVSPFLDQQVFSAGVRYEIGRGADRVRLSAETGAAVGRAPTAMTAHRVTLDAQKTFKVGPLSGLARTLLGLGDSNLLLHKRYRLGQATFEDTWRNAAARTIYGVDERVLTLPFGAFSGVGPVGYFNTNRDAGNRTTRFVGGSATAPRMWAGSVEVGLPQPVEAGVLAPLSLSLFSGAAILWGDPSSGDFGRRRFNPRSLVADAGVGATYDVSRLNLINRLVPQSDVLQTLRLTARLPFWLSDPQKVDPDENAFAFRYLFGLQVGW